MAQNERKGFFSRLFNRDNQQNEEKQPQQEKQIEQENKREEKTKAQPATPVVSSTVKTLQRLQNNILKYPRANLDKQVLDVMKTMKPEEYTPHLDVTSYLKARAVWAERALEDELSHPINNPRDENVHVVYARTLEKEKEAAAQFFLAVSAVPDAQAIVSATVKEQIEMREKLTPQQQEYRQLEQSMMRSPHGDFDMGVILTLKTEDPINYEGHIDFDAYWKRRAEWAERIGAGVTQFGEDLVSEQNCVKRFLQIVAEIPRVQQLVETEMARLREEREAIRKREPASPQARFAFDMAPPAQQKEHSTFNDYNISGIGFVVPNQGGGLDEPSGLDDRSQ